MGWGGTQREEAGGGGWKRRGVGWDRAVVMAMLLLGCQYNVSASVREEAVGLTSLAVRLPLLHVEGLVPDGHLAGSTQEALDVVGHLQGMHDLLRRGECMG